MDYGANIRIGTTDNQQLRKVYRGWSITSNRDTAEWLSMFDDVLLAQSAVDRFKNAAYDFVMEGASYRPRLKPKLDDVDPPPNTPAPKPRLHPRSHRRR